MMNSYLQSPSLFEARSPCQLSSVFLAVSRSFHYLLSFPFMGTTLLEWLLILCNSSHALDCQYLLRIAAYTIGLYGEKYIMLLICFPWRSRRKV